MKAMANAVVNGLKDIFRQVVNRVGNFFYGQGNALTTEHNSVISDDMTNAIESWLNLYMGAAPWLEKNKASLKLPVAIATEISRLVTLEMQLNISEDGVASQNTANNSRAEFLSKQLKPLKDNIRVYCEYGCAGGGMMFKPYFDGKNISIDCVKATDFKPLAFDSKGKITACIFVEHKKQNDKFYHRVEKHELKADGVYVVTNKAYKSSAVNSLGTETYLTDVPEWQELQPVQTLNNITAPLFAYFKVPLGNAVDMNSPLGVSVFARAVDLIEDADKQYQRYLWEFEGGELAVNASEEVFTKDKNGRPILPVGRERLYRPFDMDGANDKFIDTFSPSLREVELKNGLNSILQKIEFNTGLAYGTLSDPQTIDKTATEIITSKQRSYSTITDIQRALQSALEDLIKAVDIYASLYRLAPEGEYSVSFVWDDSIIVDADAERSRDMSEVRMGIMQKWEYRMKWYGEDEETARQVIADNEAEKAQNYNTFNLS